MNRVDVCKLNTSFLCIIKMGDMMKKITILALHLGYGGIEKSIASLANILIEKYDVEIISTYKILENPAFKINDKVKIKYLIENVKPNKEKWKRTIKSKRLFAFLKESIKSLYCLFLRRTRTINAIKQIDSDVIISTRTLFNNWTGKYASKTIKKVAWEHNHHHGNVKYAKKVVISCKNMDKLVLVSKSLKKFYEKELKEKNYQCKTRYIPNVIEYLPKELASLKEKKLISIGRFSREKGFPDLIEVFKIVHEEDKNIKLDLIGDGAQRNMIVDKIYEYKLENEINVHGFLEKEKIYPLLKNASLYIMTSYTESFGIVLIEAMSFGVPCIAYTSAEGARDLIEDGINGYLIPNRDQNKMKEKILELLSDNKKLKELGMNARKTSEKYKIELIKEYWFKLLK